MNRYDCYLSYSHKDERFARQLKDYMISQGISVFFCPDDFCPDDIKVGVSYTEAIANAIRNCDSMVVLLSESSIASRYVQIEVTFAIETAENRNKLIIPVLLDNCKVEGAFLFLLGGYQWISVNTKESSWPESISPFLQSLVSSKRKAFLYEELSEYEKNDLYLKASSVITEIIGIIISHILPSKSLRDQFERIIELDKCLEQLHAYYDHCDCDYSKEAREVTQQKLDMLAKISDFASQISNSDQDLFTVCCMIRLIYWDREIRRDCADMITHGDVSAGFVHTLPESEYADKQEDYRSIYISTDLKSIEEQSETVRLFITETEKYLYPYEPKFRKRIEKNLLKKMKGWKQLQSIFEMATVFLNLSVKMKKQVLLFGA